MWCICFSLHRIHRTHGIIGYRNANICIYELSILKSKEANGAIRGLVESAAETQRNIYGVSILKIQPVLYPIGAGGMKMISHRYYKMQLTLPQDHLRHRQI